MATREEIDKVLILATGKTGNELDVVKAKLSDLGVVMKVERECSYCGGTGFQRFEINGSSPVCPFCSGTKKYEALEPLIEEITDGR